MKNRFWGVSFVSICLVVTALLPTLAKTLFVSETGNWKTLSPIVYAIIILGLYLKKAWAKELTKGLNIFIIVVSTILFFSQGISFIGYPLLIFIQMVSLYMISESTNFRSYFNN